MKPYKHILFMPLFYLTALVFSLSAYHTQASEQTPIKSKAYTLIPPLLHKGRPAQHRKVQSEIIEFILEKYSISKPKERLKLIHDVVAKDTFDKLRDDVRNHLHHGNREEAAEAFRIMVLVIGSNLHFAQVAVQSSLPLAIIAVILVDRQLADAAPTENIATKGSRLKAHAGMLWSSLPTLVSSSMAPLQTLFGYGAAKPSPSQGSQEPSESPDQAFMREAYRWAHMHIAEFEKSKLEPLAIAELGSERNAQQRATQSAELDVELTDD